jgi:hypothetical protein
MKRSPLLLRLALATSGLVRQLRAALQYRAAVDTAHGK